MRVSTQLEGLPLPDPQMTPIPGPSTVAATKPRASNKSTSTIGKMISIAEIVKRSYSESAKAAFARKKGKAKAAVEEDEAGRSVLRIHQYNRIACLEELGYEGDENGDEDEAQAQVIQDWLVSGKVKRCSFYVFFVHSALTADVTDRLGGTRQSWSSFSTAKRYLSCPGTPPGRKWRSTDSSLFEATNAERVPDISRRPRDALPSKQTRHETRKRSRSRL